MFSKYCVYHASLNSYNESYTHVMELFAQNSISTNSRTFDVETRSSTIVLGHVQRRKIRGYQQQRRAGAVGQLGVEAQVHPPVIDLHGFNNSHFNAPGIPLINLFSFSLP